MNLSNFLFGLSVFLLLLLGGMTYTYSRGYNDLQHRFNGVLSEQNAMMNDYITDLHTLNTTVHELKTCVDERQYYTNKLIECKTETTTTISTGQVFLLPSVETTTTVLSRGISTPLPVKMVLEEDAETRTLLCFGRVNKTVRGSVMEMWGEVPCL